MYSCCGFWNCVSALLHLLWRVDECSDHSSPGDISCSSSDLHVYSLYCDFCCPCVLWTVLSFCVCRYGLSIHFKLEHVTIRFRKEYMKAVLRHDVEFIESVSPGRLGQRFSEESSRIVIGLGPDLGMMVRYVTSLVMGVFIGLYYVLDCWVVTE